MTIATTSDVIKRLQNIEAEQGCPVKITLDGTPIAATHERMIKE